ncbi:MAG: PmbA/TldA family metallopeptidase, partial [Candidatus Angelobacter sp.]
MKSIADWALNTATQRGAGYADVRIVDDRQRSLATKNAKVGHASNSESFGLGVRVLVNNAWGFAATDDLDRHSVDQAAAKAVEIAQASARVMEHPVRLAAEPPAKIDWATPCKIDPFSTSVAENLDLLIKIDSELLSVPGVTLAESNLHFGRYEQWFHSTEGSDIHQTRYSTGAGFAALSFHGTEIQKRSYPNSFGGQYQSKGYELVGELKLLENARRIGEEAVALHKADQCPQGNMTVVL